MEFSKVQKQVDALIKEREECQQSKDKAHKRIIEINAYLRKLEAIAKDAEEVLNGKESSAETLQAIGENLK